MQSFFFPFPPQNIHKKIYFSAPSVQSFLVLSLLLCLENALSHIFILWFLFALAHFSWMTLMVLKVRVLVYKRKTIILHELMIVLTELSSLKSAQSMRVKRVILSNTLYYKNALLLHSKNNFPSSFLQQHHHISLFLSLKHHPPPHHYHHHHPTATSEENFKIVVYVNYVSLG